MVRAISGDKSDNLGGVGGAGIPTVSKRIPQVKEEKSYMIDEIIQFCNEADSKIKFYSSVVENEKLIRENYKLMQLYSPSMSIQDVQKIDYALENSECTFKKTEIVKMMMQDGFGETNFEDLYIQLHRIMLENC